MKNALNQRKHAAIVFFDLSKTFGTVHHDILLQHLSKLNLSAEDVYHISNYLSNRKQRVRLGSGYSNWLPVSSGVPQGSLLGPLLILVHVNDIERTISKSKIMPHADDAASYYSSENKRNLIRNISADLVKLIQNLSSLSLKVNVSKTKLLLISKCNTSDFPKVGIGKWSWFLRSFHR